MIGVCQVTAVPLVDPKSSLTVSGPGNFAGRVRVGVPLPANWARMSQQTGVPRGSSCTASYVQTLWRTFACPLNQTSRISPAQNACQNQKVVARHFRATQPRQLGATGAVRPVGRTPRVCAGTSEQRTTPHFETRPSFYLSAWTTRIVGGEIS